MLSSTRLAVVGDFGADVSGYGAQEASVANMVKGWDAAAAPLDGVLTLGDNNYETGEWSTIDRNIGQYYSPFIGNYVGGYGTGAANNKFWPSPGNHDWTSTVDHDGDGVVGLDPYTDYFTLPNNERYYDVVVGNVHVFSIDSEPNEPDGTSSTSVQAQWVKSRMEASTAPWQVVIFHEPAYSSGGHGSNTTMQWPFAQWGADMVLAGHDHSYERLDVDGTPYIVNGVGGKGLSSFNTPLPQSQYRYNADVGAQLLEATETTLTASFYNSGYYQSKTLLDTITLDKNTPPSVYSTATFQQNVGGYAGTHDTQVQSYGPDLSYGGVTEITVDSDEPPNTGHDSQGLLRFEDIFGTGAGQVPAGSEIVSATLQLNVTNPGTQVNVHRMLAGWSEADTWNTLNNGVSADGSEAASAPAASFTPSATGTYSIDVTGGLAAWSADPLSNNGWALLPTNTDGVDFYSSEGAVPPKLVVKYNPPSDLPVVTVSANDPTAAEPGLLDNGQYTVTRTGDTSADLVVNYSLGGSASAGDYATTPSGSVTIPAGQASATIDLIVQDDSAYEGQESVVLTLGADAAYRLGSPGSATVTIADDELPPPVVTVVATDATASEAGDEAAFTVSRTGDLTGPLDVQYSVGGTATAGDYQPLSGTVTIPAGSSSATFSLVAVNDTAYEPNETVLITLADGASYDLGTPQSATATITSDDPQPVAPAAPANLTGNAVNGGRIDLSWTDKSDNETSFLLEWSRDGKTWTTLSTLGADSTTYSKTGLAKSTFYYFRVKAVNSFGSSAWSNVLKIRSAAR